MGRNDFADILEVTLKEEKAADAKLTQVAEARVNRKASGRSPQPKARKAARKPARGKARRKAA